MASVPLNCLGEVEAKYQPNFAPITDAAPLATLFPGRGMGSVQKPDTENTPPSALRNVGAEEIARKK